jgi:hypothetical protein
MSIESARPIRDLIQQLQSGDAIVRVRAAQGLGGLRPTSVAITNALTAAAERDADPLVRRAAWIALKSADPRRVPGERQTSVGEAVLRGFGAGLMAGAPVALRLALSLMGIQVTYTVASIGFWLALLIGWLWLASPITAGRKWIAVVPLVLGLPLPTTFVALLGPAIAAVLINIIEALRQGPP